MELVDFISVAVIFVLIYMFVFGSNPFKNFRSWASEGMVRDYIPFTRSQFGVNSGAPLFYSPVLMKQTNRCGDNGYNY